MLFKESLKENIMEKLYYKHKTTILINENNLSRLERDNFIENNKQRTENTFNLAKRVASLQDISNRRKNSNSSLSTASSNLSKNNTKIKSKNNKKKTTNNKNNLSKTKNNKKTKSTKDISSRPDSSEDSDENKEQEELENQDKQNKSSENKENDDNKSETSSLESINTNSTKNVKFNLDESDESEAESSKPQPTLQNTQQKSLNSDKKPSLYKKFNKQYMSNFILNKYAINLKVVDNLNKFNDLLTVKEKEPSSDSTISSLISHKNNKINAILPNCISSKSECSSENSLYYSPTPDLPNHKFFYKTTLITANSKPLLIKRVQSRTER
jgi:hypothetical protein